MMKKSDGKWVVKNGKCTYGDLRMRLLPQTQPEEKSIADLRTFGYMMYEAIKGPGSVHEGLKWLASLSHIYIDAKRCPTSFKEFMGYEYDRDKDGNVITGYPDKDNHSIDAVRYAMERVWRRRGQ